LREKDRDFAALSFAASKRMQSISAPFLVLKIGEPLWALVEALVQVVGQLDDPRPLPCVQRGRAELGEVPLADVRAADRARLVVQEEAVQERQQDMAVVVGQERRLLREAGVLRERIHDEARLHRARTSQVRDEPVLDILPGKPAGVQMAAEEDDVFTPRFVRAFG
jgi:hypothetical protein